MDKVKETRLKVLRSLCHHDCDIMYSWVPLPTTVIANTLGISLHQCRKAMHQLVAEGLAVRDSCIVDREENSPPYNGFRLTDVGRKTGIYMYTALQSARICAKCFGGSVECFLPEGFDLRWLYPQELRKGTTEDSPCKGGLTEYGHHNFM